MTYVTCPTLRYHPAGGPGERVIAGLGVTVLRKGEERLVARSQAGDEAGYATALAAVRAWTLVTIALIVITIFFMAARPFG